MTIVRLVSNVVLQRPNDGVRFAEPRLGFHHLHLRALESVAWAFFISISALHDDEPWILDAVAYTNAKVLFTHGHTYRARLL